jgi:hypothetical protein
MGYRNYNDPKVLQFGEPKSGSQSGRQSAVQRRVRRTRVFRVQRRLGEIPVPHIAPFARPFFETNRVLRAEWRGLSGICRFKSYRLPLGDVPTPINLPAESGGAEVLKALKQPKTSISEGCYTTVFSVERIPLGISTC